MGERHENGGKQAGDNDDLDRFFVETEKDIEEALKHDKMFVVGAVLTENETLRRMASRSHQAFLAMAVVFIIACSVAYAGWTRDQIYRFFYVDQAGDVYETHGFEYPTANRTRVKNHAIHVATALHSWSYKPSAENYFYTHFQQLERYCRKGVIMNYYMALGDQGVFKTADQYKQRYGAFVAKARVEGERNIGGGKKAWRVSLVVNEEVTGSTKPVSNTYDMVIDIEQTTLNESVAGLVCTRIDENFE